jgi:hypothetical protein
MLPAPCARAQGVWPAAALTSACVRFVRQPQPKECPTLLFFHANAGNMGMRLPNIVAIYQRLKWNVFIVSYRGYGESSGAPSGARACTPPPPRHGRLAPNGAPGPPRSRSQRRDLNSTPRRPGRGCRPHRTWTDAESLSLAARWAELSPCRSPPSTTSASRRSFSRWDGSELVARVCAG